VITSQDALHMLRIDRELQDAYWYIAGEFFTDDQHAKIHFNFVQWMIAGGKDQFYHMSMWAATNRDLLREWVLDYIIEQDWA
jgi:hypothetical protein